MTDELIAIIAEGGAERTILDMLLDAHYLRYERADLLQEQIFEDRSANKFARKYLGLEMPKPIHIYRVLDSRNERFELPKATQHKVVAIDDLYTRPEIEMLYILDADVYKDYEHSGIQKPSAYVKQKLGLGKMFKSPGYVRDYWQSRLQRLVEVIEEYSRLTQDAREHTLAALLR